MWFNVVQRLVEIVGKGGNYLLNIGPMADGTVPAPSVAKRSEHLRGPGVSAAGGALLAEPWRKLPVARDRGGIGMSLPAHSQDEMDTVVVVELGPLRPAPPIVTQGSDSPFELDYLKAVTAGRAVKRFNRAGKSHVSKWTGPHDSVAWHLLVSQTGRYKVTIRYSARSAWENRRYIVEIGGQSITAVVGATGEGYQYKAFDLGYVRIPKAGEYTVSIRPAEDSDRYLMYLQSLSLEPVGAQNVE
jgi:alpha-L-fucosidase